MRARIHGEKASSDSALALARELAAARGGTTGCRGQWREPWTRPNFLLQASADILIPEEIHEPITDDSPVVDNILGTAIRGKAHTDARVAMRLVTNDEAAQFELVLRGKTKVNSRGVNGPATLFSTSEGDFQAVTHVRFGDKGLTFDPPRATATSHSTVRDLRVPRRGLIARGDERNHLVEGIARRKAEKLRPQADAIAVRHAEARYEKSMAEYVATFLERTNGPYRAHVLEPLAALNASWEYARFSSTDKFLRLACFTPTAWN